MKLIYCIATVFLFTVTFAQQLTFMQNCNEEPTPEARQICLTVSYLIKLH